MWNLIANLPDGSATWRARDTPNAWTIADHLLASAVELLQETNVLLLKAHFEVKGAAPEVKRLPRPGAPVERRPARTIQDIRRALLG